MTSQPPTTRACLTVPELARRLEVPLDRLRKLIRGTPAAAAFLARLGPTRVLPATLVNRFQEALGLELVGA